MCWYQQNERGLDTKRYIFETTYVCVFSTKFQVSNIILTSFRPEVVLSTPQNEPLKHPSRLGLKRKQKN